VIVDIEGISQGEYSVMEGDRNPQQRATWESILDISNGAKKVFITIGTDVTQLDPKQLFPLMKIIDPSSKIIDILRLDGTSNIFGAGGTRIWLFYSNYVHYKPIIETTAQEKMKLRKKNTVKERKRKRFENKSA
jgi:hypothetical protein